MHKLWIATLAAAVLCSSQASAINTHKDWDGNASISTFGCFDTTTYGQVITIPKFRSTLGNFSFFVIAPLSGHMVVRGEAYQWDSVNSRATGSAVYESDPRKISYKDTNYHRMTFNADVHVTPGAQYIVFATVDKDIQQCSPGYELSWASVPDTTYKGGDFYYFEGDGTPSRWTAESWYPYNNMDLAFTATLLIH